MTVKCAILHTHTTPIHYHHARSMKRAKCKSFKRQIYIFPVPRTQKESLHSIASGPCTRYQEPPLNTVQRGNNRSCKIIYTDTTFRCFISNVGAEEGSTYLGCWTLSDTICLFIPVRAFTAQLNERPVA